MNLGLLVISIVGICVLLLAYWLLAGWDQRRSVKRVNDRLAPYKREAKRSLRDDVVHPIFPARTPEEWTYQKTGELEQRVAALEERAGNLWTIVENWVADSRPLDLQVASLRQRVEILEAQPTDSSPTETSSAPTAGPASRR